jgi:asparagine synthetase B (glutamine-hydrolysing)
LLDKLIWHLETVISVRASVPMFLSKAITESGSASGEGADEILEVICILEMHLRRNFKRNN